MVLLVPVFCVLATMAVQAAIWGHTRSQVRSVARAATVIAARGDVTPSAAAASVQSSLRSIDDVVVDSIEVSASGGNVVTVIRGRLSGLVHGVSVPIDVAESTPIEGWRVGW